MNKSDSQFVRRILRRCSRDFIFSVRDEKGDILMVTLTRTEAARLDRIADKDFLTMSEVLREQYKSQQRAGYGSSGDSRREGAKPPTAAVKRIHGSGERKG